MEQPAGAFLTIRRDVWEKLGGFDEGFYPVWFEDVDFCKRALEAGYKIRYVPAARGTHIGGHSVHRLPTDRKASFWYGSLLRYAAKHFSGWGYRLVGLAAAFSCAPRMVAGMFEERSLKPIPTYTGIFFSSLKLLWGRRGTYRPGPGERA